MLLISHFNRVIISFQNIIRVSKSRMMSWAEHVAHSYRILVGRLTDSRPPCGRFEEIQIKLILKALCMGLECIHLAQDAVQLLAFLNIVMNQLVPCLVGDF
jgi:hypothetical protein